MDINSEGLIDYRSLRFFETLVVNDHKLSYQRADKLLASGDSELAQALQILGKVTAKRRAMREKVEGFALDKNQKGTQSSIIVEELMLIAHQGLQCQYYDVLEKLDFRIEAVIQLIEQVKEREALAKKARAEEEKRKAEERKAAKAKKAAELLAKQQAKAEAKKKRLEEAKAKGQKLVLVKKKSKQADGTEVEVEEEVPEGAPEIEEEPSAIAEEDAVTEADSEAAAKEAEAIQEEFEAQEKDKELEEELEEIKLEK